MAVVERPAPFLTVCELVRPVPSPVMVVSAGAVGIPDSGSEAVQWTVTSPWYQPLVPFGCVVGAPDRVGAVVSPLGAVEEVDFVFPAPSVAVPVTVTPGWTVLELLVEPSARQVATPDDSCPPDSESSQVKVTVVVPSAFLS